MPIDKIVILDPRSQPPAVPRFTYLLRLAVPRWRQAQFASAVTESRFPNADAETLAALRAGALVERVAEYTAAAGVTWAQMLTATAQRAQVQADLVTALGVAQAE